MWVRLLLILELVLNKFPVHTETGRPDHFIKLVDLQTIMNLRLEEMLTLIRDKWQKEDLLPQLGAGIVITGGGTYINRLTELVEKTFGLPCIIGHPKDVSGLALVTEGPEYAAAVGMLRYGTLTAQKSRPLAAFTSLIRSLFKK